MKHWMTFLLVLAWTAAHAATLPAISLEPPNGQTQLNQTTLQVIQGQCGQTTVKLVGVVDVLNGVYLAATDESRLTLSLNNRTVTFATDSGIFNDVNGITCATTKIGKRLLFWSNCSGTVCEGQMSFFVVDPVTLKRIVTGKGNDQCNATCASNLMGGDKLPFLVAN